MPFIVALASLARALAVPEFMGNFTEAKAQRFRREAPTSSSEAGDSRGTATGTSARIRRPLSSISPSSPCSDRRELDMPRCARASARLSTGSSICLQYRRIAPATAPSMMSFTVTFSPFLSCLMNSNSTFGKKMIFRLPVYSILRLSWAVNASIESNEDLARAAQCTKSRKKRYVRVRMEGLARRRLLLSPGMLMSTASPFASEKTVFMACTKLMPSPIMWWMRNRIIVWSPFSG
mmetsp:Transcript_12346/g.35700  ORF Transcript_12346/g.35700 Transcript_12346/m.35700 type:complete len:235 (-) Transcript_12346:447-1151(-)